jgi:hypothetical protein
MVRQARGPLVVLLTFISSMAWASSPRPRELPERALAADRVVLAEVLSSKVDIPDGDVRRMTTRTSVVVLEDYRGHGPRELTVSQLGGKDGLWQLTVSGSPTLVPGEVAVLFLRCAQPGECTLSGLSDAKVPVVGEVGRQDALVQGPRGGAARVRLEELADRVRAAKRPIDTGAQGGAR